MSNEGRELTLQVKITDPQRASWIWKLLGDPQRVPELGITLNSVSDTDVAGERDRLEEQRNWLLEYVGNRAAAHLEAELKIGSVESAPWSHGLLALLRDD